MIVELLLRERSSAYMSVTFEESMAVVSMSGP
jgi:hypothetical protein